MIKKSSRLERRVFPQQAVTGPVTMSKLKIRWGAKGNDPYLLELPQQLELMAAKLANGESFYSVLATQVDSAHGRFAEGLSRLRHRLQLGESIEVALQALDQEAQSPVVSEFCNKVSIALTRGTPMAQQFEYLSETARNQLRNQVLRQAGKNELKMLIPMVFMILPVTILFAVYPSMQLLQLGQ